MPSASVLVVDDSADMVTTLERYLGDHDWTVRTALGGAEALESFAREPADVVLTDLRMKGTDGIDVLEGIRQVDEETPVVLMTAFGTVESAVDAIHRGAYHYVTKPFKMAVVRTFLERAVTERRARGQGRALRAGLTERFVARGFVGGSGAMRELAALVELVARTTSPVLVVGETGTGKELVARAIHAESDRRDGPFVSVSCAALPGTVQEDELFAQADGGTIFLDEVADLPLALQGKLLRVLESGGPVDVRCVASTQTDLGALVQARAFREDLFFRLDVIPIRMVPLRERREDLPPLIDHQLARAQERTKDAVRRRFSSEALRLLEAHDWPGNVRELQNVVQRLVVTTTTAEIGADAVRAALRPLLPRDPAEALAAAHLSLEEVEDRYVDAVLRQSRGNKADAAAILGIDVSTIYRRKARKRK